MRILQVHKYLYRKAGAEAYVLDLVELLKAHGHEVLLWGPEEPLNFDRREGVWRDLKKFGRMVWSFEAARKFERVLKQFQPDVVHVHNIYHHISPSILAVAACNNIPVVMTVHDYHLVNPNYVLYDHGAICERRGFSAIAHRCIKNSFVASVADVIEWQVHRWLGIYQHTISRYLAPTEFVKGKLVEGGVERGKIEVVSLPVAHNPPPPSLILREGDDRDPPLKVRGGSGSYVLFSGRLTEEKGIYLILEIAKHLPEINFKIAGDGPELENVKCKIKNEKLTNIELLGFVEKEKLQGLIAGARIVLVPSLWYDPSPLAVLEAMATGKVVVASKIGGIPELIKDSETGVLISPMSPIGHIVDAIRKIYYDDKLLARVGKAAQEYVRRVHSPEKHYARLRKIYEETINRAYRTN